MRRGAAAFMLLAALLMPAPPALAQAGPDKPPSQPRLPQVISPLDPPAPQVRGMPRVITPMDLPPLEGPPTAVMPPQPAAAPGTAFPVRPGGVCSTQQTAIVNAALAEARRRIAAGIQLLREDPEHPHITLWFGTASRGVVLDVLQRTSTRLSNTAGMEMRCNDAARCVGAVTAYAQVMTRTLVDANGRPAATFRLDEGQVLGVCPGFFQAGMDGTGTRWGVLVHEGTHFAAATRDHVYGRAASLALARDAPARAVENADNYMLFIETLPRR